MAEKRRPAAYLEQAGARARRVARATRLTPTLRRFQRRAAAGPFQRSARGAEEQPPAESFAAQLHQLLPARRDANVAVLAEPDTAELPAVLDSLRGARIHVFSMHSRPEWQLRRRGIGYVAVNHIGRAAWHFQRFGPFDAVVNCATAGKDGQFSAFRRLFFHLRAGGVYVQNRAVATDDQWSALIGGLAKLPPLSDSQPGGNTPRHELGLAIGKVVVDRQAIAITKATDHWLKLRFSETDRFLPTRDVNLSSRIISTRPKRMFTSRAELDLHISTTEPPDFLPRFDCPQLYLHTYTGDITMASHSLLYGDSTVLPESFRQPTFPVMRNTKLIDPSYKDPESAPPWSVPFARVPDDLQAERTLEGDYYHLDCPYPGHFGHLMTEVVSRLWGWERAKRDNPDLKAILRVYRDDKTPRLEKTLFTAYGIPKKDLVWVGAPVRLHSVTGATPMWQNKHPHYVHPDIAGVWDRLRDGLLLQAGSDSPPVTDRLFVSRRPGARRACRNSGEVERYFTDRGYQVVYPETMSLPEQAALFAGAREVAGFGGSAMFNILYARNLEKLIVLTHDSYVARNEYLFASVLGAQTHYVWSDPDLWQSEVGTVAAFQSDWEFDFGRNRDILDKIT